MNGERKQQRWWEWTLGLLTVAAILGTAQGHRLRVVGVEDVAFGTLLLLVILFVAMAWWRFARALSDAGTKRWRVWVSLAGCVALQLAFAVPFIPFVRFYMALQPARWDVSSAWLVVSVISVVGGVFAAKPVRFPLILGGIVLGSLAVMTAGAVL